jgi:transcriptional regulator with XRE-family HTH domain
MSTSLDMDIGLRIKEARRAAGFKNAEQFAVALDVGFSTVQRWEQGKTTPSVRRLREIAAVTRMPLAFFITEPAA